jgi:hypothetical protein
MLRPATLLACALLLAAPAPAWSRPKEKKPVPSSAPASRTSVPAPEGAPSSQASDDAISRLPVVTPRGKLPPLSTVRVRDKREAQDRSRTGTITVTISTSPKGAAVYYGGKLLGTTPLALTAQRGSTPYDVVIRRGGYMTLRTRIMRKTTRGYSFKLTPAKLR